MSKKVKKMEVTPKAITQDELKKVTDLQTELQSYLEIGRAHV